MKGCWLFIFFTLNATAQTSANDAFFESRIRPILAENCYMCHSRDAKAARGGLVLDTRNGVRQGGQSGPAIVPGKPQESLLIRAVRQEGRLRMPPGAKLSEQAIADLTNWVQMGARDPREEKSAPPTSTIDLKKGREFWAFQPPVKPPLPKVKHKSWVKDPVDRFLLAKLEQKRITPVADADRAALLRRVTFDLIGLPPAPEEIDAFLKDRGKHAYETVVDRLLASPQFGERWGRHWLDVARHADSIGRTRNFAFPVAWRYRDWVIQALNEDKPYDRFVAEQLAGDLMPGRTPEERNARLVATAFLALGALDLNENDRRLALMDRIDEQINVSTKAFLGLTVGCARCHDHKFDPIPTTDYYALAGIFRSTETFSGLRQRPPNGSSAFSIDRLIRLDGVGAYSSGDPVEIERKREDLWAQLLKAERPRDPQLLRQLTRQLNLLPMPENLTMGVSDVAKPEDCEVNQRGDPHSPGPKVPRGFVQVLSPEGQAMAIPPSASGRLELALWITRPGNPLTARVMVNRIWYHLFGRGIVDTVDNFGKSGSRPTHPELLDYLAVRFEEQGWSVKKVIREIVLSHTYQLSTAYSARNFAIEPDNTLLWRQNHRRLDAEAIRDSLLAVSGKLDLKPPAGSPIVNLPRVDLSRNPRVQSWERTDPHRTVYLPVVRNNVSRFLETFDFPEPSESRGRRDITTVAPQALYLMNDPFVGEQARAAAEKTLAVDGTDAVRVRLAYRRVLSRDPSAADLDRALAYLEAGREAASGDDAAAAPDIDSWARFYQALFASAEFRYH